MLKNFKKLLTSRYLGDIMHHKLILKAVTKTVMDADLQRADGWCESV